MMEVAGTKADIIIANPNGIVGNNFGFINANRATLVTGTPNIVNGNIESFNITGGKVDITGSGIQPVINETTGKYKYEPVSKLDIMTAAANINAELWAKDEINIITGKNKVSYNTNTPASLENSENSSVSLDVGALGGMYAGKITLVGTNKGLGMNIAGNISAQKNLNITSDGKITFTKSGDVVKDDSGNIIDSDETVINSDGEINLQSSSSIESSANISARSNINITAAALNTSGKIIAGEEYEQDETNPDSPLIKNAATLDIKTDTNIKNTGTISASDNLKITAKQGTANLSGSISADNNIDIKAAGQIDVKGNIYSDKGNINVTGEKVNYSKENIQAKDENSITITETNPDKDTSVPEDNPPRQAEDITTPNLPAVTNTPDIAETVAQNKTSDDSLKLVADENAGIYRPIIDKAANGIDLVQIAQVDANGVSRNLYTDFNIKSSGLILNNATEYTKTQLGGYIDKNMYLAGNGAKIILNEVTSSNPSVLNGYLEVAGHTASVVIANANGISVNGLGFINTDNAVISTGKANLTNNTIKFSGDKGDMQINGDGLNGRGLNSLSLTADNITVNKSELWGNELTISADGKLSTTSKIAGTKNVNITANSLDNMQNGYIEAGQNLNIAVQNDLKQNSATIKAGNNLSVSANNLNSRENSLISAGNNAVINAQKDISNDKAIILAGNDLNITSNNLSNSNTALINYNNGKFKVAETLKNDNATISGNQGTTSIQTKNLDNVNQGALVTAGDLTLNANNINNDNSNIYINSESNISAATLNNTNDGSIYTGRDMTLKADNLVNNKSMIDTAQNVNITAENITNSNSAYISAEQNMDITTGLLDNKSQSFIFTGKDLTVKAQGNVTNEDALIATGGNAAISADNIYNKNDSAYKEGSIINAAGNLKLTAQNTLLNQSSNIESQKDISITAKDLNNKKDKFTTGWDITYENISYKIPPLDAPNYYDAMRQFLRTIHTGVIKEETDDANIISGGNMNINLADKLTNNYSKIMAGKDLTVNASSVENIGYQGTIHHDDAGQDNHYWKYKKHKRFHIGCHMVYGTTVIPYEDHNVYDKTGANSERLSVLSAVGTVKIVADNVVNKTLEADGTQYENRTKTVDTTVDSKLKNVENPDTLNKMLDISQLQINSKIYTLNNDPSAKYLIETNPKYADYHKFLSSDYLLERVKADPEKVAKRLGDGYFEQQYVINQITALTGKPYLDSYGSDMEQFKALMNAGATVADELNLKVGVSLTKEQIAALTSDIVWLVTENVNGEEVLVPQVYLANLKEKDLTQDGALITGTDVEIYTKGDLQNIGTIKADKTVELKGDIIENKGGNIKGENVNISATGSIINRSGEIAAKVDAILNAGSIINETATTSNQYKELHTQTVNKTASISAGNNLTLNAENAIENKSSNLSAGKELNLNANDINISTVLQEKHVAVTNNKSYAEIHSVENQQSVLSGEDVNINAKNNVNLKGTLIDSDNANISAGNDVNISAVKDFSSEESTVGEKGGSYYNHNKKADEVVKGTNIATTENTTINAGKDINIKGSDITSEKGNVSLTGKNVNIQNETEYHERLHELHEEASGVLSSKTTDIYDYSNENSVVGSSISAGSVDITSSKDTNITASSIVADNDVNISAGENLNINSAQQTNESEYIKQVKKSGLLSGGGLGFTIGKEKQRDEYTNQNSEAIGSTIGSLNSDINLTADKNIDVTGSNIIADKDINITGANVNIANSNSVYNSEEKHEYEKSGLSISVGGGAIDTVANAVSHIQRADEVKDDRLSALYGYKAYEDIKDTQKALTNPKAGIGLNVSLGSQKSASESRSTTIISNASKIKANGDINILATDKDINIQGSNVTGENVNLNAKENITITASADTNKTDSSYSSSSSSIGATITPGGIAGADISHSRADGNIAENSTTYNESTVTADKNLTVNIGKNMNIIGGIVTGEKVTADIGSDLNIETKQDKNNYSEKNSSSGINLSLNGDITGGMSSGNTDSRYESATSQSGIYAGSEGFDIYVEDNTDLKGGIISSETDKNKLSTGTLTFEDVHNSAEYSSSSKGININTGKNADKKDAGITPNIGMPAEDEANSNTKATIAKGEIEIRDKEHQKQNINELNRNTENSLNKLGEIFDKETIEERQELAQMFGETAYKAVGDLALKNGWKEGSAEKNALHALVGGIMSKLGGSDFISGASGAMVNEMIQNKLAETFKDDPAMHQWASALIGGVVSGITSGNVQTGASAASSGTKNNWLSHAEQVQMLKELQEAGSDITNPEVRKRRAAIYAKYAALDLYNDEHNPLIFADVIDGELYHEMMKDIVVDEYGMTHNLAEILSSYSDQGAYYTAQYEREKLEKDPFYHKIYDEFNNSDFYGSTDATGDYDNYPPPETVTSILDNGGYWNEQGQLIRADGSISYTSPTKGDYLYNQGDYNTVADPQTNRIYVRTDDGDYPIYSLGYAGDYFAEHGATVIQGEDGANYAIVDGKSYYTTAPVTEIRNLTPEEEFNSTLSDLGKDVPVLDIVDDTKIVATGTDLGGYSVTPGEEKEAKENLAMGVVTLPLGTISKGANVAEASVSKATEAIIAGYKSDTKHILYGSKGTRDGHAWEVLFNGEKPTFEQIKPYLTNVIENGELSPSKGKNTNIIRKHLNIKGYDIWVKLYNNKGNIILSDAGVNAK